MKQMLPHIKIGAQECGQVQIVVEDCELSDFIEDYLVEKCGIEIISISFTEVVGVKTATMYFPESVSMLTLEEALSELSQKKIQSIYNLNNN